LHIIEIVTFASLDNATTTWTKGGTRMNFMN